MKRYVYLVLICLGTLLAMTGLFYILLKQDNFNITYIKLQVNPSFVIGINKDKNVVFYNALNEDGNKYNLEMFQGKTLGEATKIFIENLGNAKDNKNEINLTVMTKNNSLEKELVNIIEKEIKLYDNNYSIVLHEPTNEELEKYSNEEIYNISSSISDKKLTTISESVYEKICNYIDNKIISLDLQSLTKEEQIEILKEKQENGFFSDYSLSNISLEEYNVFLLEKSNYTVIFSYDEEDDYMYRLVLNLEVEYERTELKKIIEVYIFNYEKASDEGKINNLRKYFYSF